MLVLTRRIGEDIIISGKLEGDRITIFNLGVKGSQVRVGIDAPNSITVHRKEIQDKIDNENN